MTAPTGFSTMSSWTPSPRELDDLELLLDGIFTPLTGFLGRADIETVRRDRRLADGTPWPAAITLSVPADVHPADALDLTDPEGTPIARLAITDHWTEGDRTFLGGQVGPLRPREDGLFRDLRLSPAAVRERFPGERLLAVPLTAPLDRAGLATVTAKATAYDRVVLLPLTGTGTPRVVSAVGLVQTAVAAAELLAVPTTVVPVPLASHGDPEVDAQLVELVAATYGDGVVGPTSDGLAAIAAALDDGEPLTEELVPPRIARVLYLDRPAKHKRGLTLLFTGLSGSGKSTVARRVRDLLLERGDRTVTLLDGDVQRRLLSSGLGFSRADRETNVRRIGYVAAEVSRHGGVAICAPIAPYASTRADVRRMVEEAGGGFVLIHVATPLAECERRDRKGLYAKARAGEIKEFTGISDPYEEPTDAELRIDTTNISVAEAAGTVLDYLTKQGWLR